MTEGNGAKGCGQLVAVGIILIAGLGLVLTITGSAALGWL